MPNIKSAIKRVKQTESKQVRNSHAKTTMRSAIRKAEASLLNKDENTSELVKYAIKLTDSAARKGLVHNNKASRLKSRLTKKAL